MKLRILFAATAAAACFASPAYAQADGSAFMGPHIELVGGFDLGKAADDDATAVDDSETSNGVLYGVAGGFDFGGASGFVFGVEAEATVATTDLCDVDVCAEVGRDLYLGGRAGTVLGGTTLLYVKGGYTNARVKGVDADGDTIDSTNLDGLRVGVGAEARPEGTPLLVKIEYRYSNYEEDFTRHQAVVGLGIRF